MHTGVRVNRDDVGAGGRVVASDASGSRTIRCTSFIIAVFTALMKGGPTVSIGTYLPSMTSKCASRVPRPAASPHPRQGP